MRRTAPKGAHIFVLTERTSRAPSAQGTYMTIRSVAKVTQCSESHLRRLLNSGRVDGIKIDNSWLTTPNAVMTYLDSSGGRNRYRRSRSA